MFRLIFNYYMVLKACWIVLVFQLIGFIGLVVMEQGKDIQRSLTFTGDGQAVVHTWFVLFALIWWSWQSWRSSRVILHFTTFDFKNFSSRYSAQAQVLIPRLLGVSPILIFSYGLYAVNGFGKTLIFIFLSLAVWFYIFLRIRRDIIVYFRSRKHVPWLHFPDYTPIKNESYPFKFIWAKQRKWILFRVILLSVVFTLVVLYPVRFPQYLGSAAIILFALGSWLVIATILDFAEKRFRFPFSFTIVVMVIVFSFFNNNHAIRTLERTSDQRIALDDHFDNWYHARQSGNDTIPVFMVAGQGGGVRSAYWMAQVLSELQESQPDFDRYTYAYSAVSGGSLGVATYKGLVKNRTEVKEPSHRILSQDFLAPVTSWLVIPDLFQKFIPVPVHSVDRAKALEYSWEYAARTEGEQFLSDGFLGSYVNDDCVYLFNSTRVENGFRTILTNVRTPHGLFSQSEDFFSVTGSDVRISTAISVSARFPFITPPALVFDSTGQKWGNLVDGGYIENMGGESLLELYDHLRKRAIDKNYKVRFYLLFVKNTKEEYTTEINGLPELIGPLNAFSKVWVNSGYYDERSPELQNLYEGDRVSFISLDRSDDSIIPLGWYLSTQATQIMQQQLPARTEEFKSLLRSEFTSE